MRKINSLIYKKVLLVIKTMTAHYCYSGSTFLQNNHV